jgi:hypothetical protein
MKEEERAELRRLSAIVPSADVKEVRSEMSRPVVAVHVVKEEIEPGSE